MSQSQRYQPITRDWVWCAEHEKRRYPTRKAAKLVLKELVRGGDSKASEMCVYDCEDWFHVGHRPWYKR